MKTSLLRMLAGAVLSLALLAAARATPTISITAPATGSTLALVSTPAGYTISATAAPTGTPAGITITSVQFAVNGTVIGTVGGASPFTVNWTPSASGTYTITATVTDNSIPSTGTNPTSNTATATSIVNVTVARAVVVAAPVSNTTFAQNSEVFFRSSAAFSDGIVSKVEYFLDGSGTALAMVNQAPYNSAIALTAANGFTTGVHTLVATATGSDGVTVVDSAAISINIVPAIGTAPTVTMTAPANGVVLPVNQNVTVSATATDADGYIPSTVGGGVTFYADGEPIGTALLAPYTITWKPTVAKAYVLRAQAVDDKGNLALSVAPGVSVTVVESTVPPTVTLTSPTAGSTVGLGTPVTLQANAAATAPATVSKVDFYLGSTLIGTDNTAPSPYTFTWTPTSAGAASLTAKVTDSNGAVTTSAAVNVTVSAAAPSVSLTVPTNGTVVPLGTSTSLTATASAVAPASVSRVDFYAGTSLLGTALVAPYTISWTPSTSGIVALTARVTDTNGTVVTSTIINVNVTVPSVSLTSPANGALLTAGTTVPMTATASAVAPAAVSRVDFYAGATLVGTALAAPYTTNWTPAAAGSVALTAKVTDSNGAVVTSATNNVTVTSVTSTVAITSPSNGDAVALGSTTTIAATATPGSGVTISRVDFLVGSTVVGTALTAPYSVNWTPNAAGIFSLTARVTDSGGATVTSPVVNVTVGSAAPTITMITPTAGATPALGSSLVLSARALPGAGAAVAKVDFLSGSTVIGTVLPGVSAPTYSFTWVPTTLGVVALTARVTDSAGATATTPVVNISVVAGKAVTLSAPANNSSIPLGSAAYLRAAVNFSDGSVVSQVEFIVGGISAGIVPRAPYNLLYTFTSLGANTVVVQATASDGTTISSSTYTINVVPASGIPPTVALTSPLATDSVLVNQTVTLNATASDIDGYIPNTTGGGVTFLVDGEVLASALNAPYTTTWRPTVAKLYVLTAQTVDDKGNVAFSTPVLVNVLPSTGGTGPSVTLSLLGGSSTMAIGSVRYLSATPTSNAAIERVEFYYDSTLLDTVSRPPYVTLFTAPAGVGAHQLTARVYDAAGLSASSAPQSIIVTNTLGAPPTVGLTAPANGAFVPVGTATAVTANALDNDGTITGVQFFANGVSLGTSTTAPYGVNWTPSTAGAYTIVAVATDDKGNAVSSPSIAVTVTDQTSPFLTLAVTPGATPTTVTTGSVRAVVATASAQGGRALVRVEFFLNGAKVSESTAAPYAYLFTAPNTPGTSTVVARATDNAGLARDAQVTFTVISAVGTGPTVSLLSPAANTNYVPGTVVPLSASAVAAGASSTITSVQFYANGAPAGGVSTAAPYSANYTLPTLPGSYTFTAIATDDRGNTAVATPVSVTAAYATPTVRITSPSANARIVTGAATNISASPLGGNGAGINRVDFYLDGVSLGTRTAAPWVVSWTPDATMVGAHAITARVTDANNNTALSAAVSVTVAAPVGSLPQVSLTGLTGTYQSLSSTNFIASAFSPSPSGSITGVEFFINGVSIGTGQRDQTSNNWRLPYNFALQQIGTGANLQFGANTIYAVARDNSGNIVTSTTSTFNLVASTSLAPTVDNLLVSPDTVTAGQPILISVDAVDPDGSVNVVQFYANGTLIGSPTTAPYTITYTPQTAGRYNIYAVATDDTGNTAVSVTTTPVVINVTQNTAPTIALVAPADNYAGTVNQPVYLEATSSDPDVGQTITVEFVINPGSSTPITATRVGTTNTYRASWTPTLATNYRIAARATDSSRGSTTSAQRTAVIANLVGIGPLVTVSAPSSASTASTVLLSATASDPDGAVMSVEFFVNGASVGQATRDQLSDNWRLATNFGSLTPGATYPIVALARDNLGNNTVSTATQVTVNVPAGAPPMITIASSTTGTSIGQPITLTATAQDADGAITSVRYYANGTSIAVSTSSGTSYQSTWTPTASGKYNIYGVATDDDGNTALSGITVVNVKAINPVTDNDAFIIQSYQDMLASTPTALNFAGLSSQFAAGTLTRSQLVANLAADTGYSDVTTTLQAYYMLMGEWPSYTNYQSLLQTAQTSLTNAVGQIIALDVYIYKWQTQQGQPAPTTTNFNGALPLGYPVVQAFVNRLYQNALGRGPSAVEILQFQNQDQTLPNLARGYNVAGVNTAIAELITKQFALNPSYTAQAAAFAKRAQAASLYYSLLKTQPTEAQVSALAALPTVEAQARVVLADQLYSYRFVTFLTQPKSLTVAVRSGAIFTVGVLAAPPLSYQWLFNGSPISGETRAFLSLTNVTPAVAGSYSVRVTSAQNTGTSDVAQLAISNQLTRLGNISTRGQAGGGRELIAGFVVSGTAARQMLIRVIGPSLSSFGLGGGIADSSLELRDSRGAVVQSNDNWATQTGGAAVVTQIENAASRVGAFTLTRGSRDAAVMASLTAGTYTVRALGVGTASGLALIEAYDVTTGTITSTNKAINVSTRGEVGTGDNVLIAGFVVTGNVARRVLIRGVGPTLSTFGVTGVLANPQLALNHLGGTSALIEQNDDWGASDDATVIRQAAAQAGAFALPNNSRDAAIIVMLEPGAYTAQLSGVNNTTGVALVEVYDVDP